MPFQCENCIKSPKSLFLKSNLRNLREKNGTAFACTSKPEEWHPAVPLALQVFRYLLLFSNEIKRKRWVDEDVNLPIFIAGLKTVVSLCHSYGTFSHVMGFEGHNTLHS